MQDALMASQQEYAMNNANTESFKANLCSCQAIISAFTQQQVDLPEIFQWVPVDKQSSVLKHIMLLSYKNHAGFAQIADELKAKQPVGEDAFPFISEIIGHPIFVDTRASGGSIITYHGQETKICDSVEDIQIKDDDKKPLYIKYGVPYVVVEGCQVDMPPHWDPASAF